MAYCTKCGASRSTKQLTGAYSPEDGTKEYRLVCSVDPCHTRHDWDYDHPWTRGFMALIEPRSAVCRRCGKKHYASD